MRRFVAELKRRHVFRVAVVYSGVAFVIGQAADISFAALDLPKWSLTLLVLLLIFGFPVALVLAWAFDLTPDGVRRTEPVPARPDWQRANQLLNAALEREPEHREAFLLRECRADDALFREVKSLLTAHSAGGRLDRLGAEVVSPVLAGFRDAGAAPAAEPPPSAGPVGPAQSAPLLAERYELRARLGIGGMGVVYEAMDTRLGRRVALKFLSPQLCSDAAAKQRFIVEARAAAALDHPNICTIHEIGVAEDDRLFIAMPLYEGETLKSRLAQGRLPILDALEIIEQVARGLMRAHQKSIVHRDIKPANLLITTEGIVKILDFGLAWRPDTDLTRPGTVLGTVAYMSPEQVRGDRLDSRADLWSLGVVLYEALTGRRPFEGASDHVLAHAILTAEPIPCRSLRPEIPAALEAVLARALAKPVDERYASASDFTRALQQAQAVVQCATGLDAKAAAAIDGGSTGQPAAAPSSGDAAAAESAASTPSQRSLGVLTAERRPAAVLSANVAGYAELIERLPPAELEVVVSRLHEEVQAVAARFGGIVNRFDGEEMMLLFGVPRTHEDDVHRSVRAALELRDRITRLGVELVSVARESLAVRTGVEAGPVIAQQLEEDGMCCKVTGEPVKTAARLAGRAEAGEVLVGPDAMRTVADSFETAACPPLRSANGVRQVAVHRVIGSYHPHSKLNSAGNAGLSPYVGRDEELRTLRRHAEAALLGEGCVVSIIGDAGSGKSRLLNEFRRSLGDGVRLLEGRCGLDESQLSYLSILNVLRAALGLPDGEPAAGTDGAAIATAVRSLAPELEESIPLYLHLLSVQDAAHPIPKHLEGEHLRIALVEALTAFVAVPSASMPTILLLEDWHAADDASREVLKMLAETATAYALLIVVTSRSAAALDLGTAQHTPIHLGPLLPDAARAIMLNVFAADQVDESLARMVRERAGGNPFFIEEICQSLLESAAVERVHGCAVIVDTSVPIQLPETVEAVIRTRLDRVDRHAREVLRVASVAGRDFAHRLLELVLGDEARFDEALQHLKALGLIHQVQLGSRPSYRFRHALVQEVAYDSLLEHQRRLLHGQVGAAIEMLAPDRLDDHLDLLVHHYSKAEDWPRAVRYGLLSVDRANALGESAEALAVLERIETWVGSLPDEAERRRLLIDVLLEQERACETLGLRARQQAIIDRLLSQVEHDDAADKRAQAYLRQGDLHTLMRRFDEAERALEDSLLICRAAADREGERNALRSLGLLRWHQSRNTEAVRIMEHALAIDRGRRDREAIVGDLANLGSVLNGLGEYEQARTYLEEALPLAAELDLPIKRCYILHHLGNVHRALGDPDQALDYLLQAYELTKQWPLPVHSFHLTTIAHIHLQHGRIDESIARYREAVEFSRRVKHAEGLSQALRMLGEVLVGLDRHAEALPVLAEAADLFSQLGDAGTEALVRARLAGAQERVGEHAAAAAAWRRACELRRAARDRTGEMEALEGLARAVRRCDDAAEDALALYQQALEIAQELGVATKEGSLLNSIGIVHWSRGDYSAALECYERALGVFERAHDSVHAGVALNSIGATLNMLGRPAEAVPRLEQAVALHVRSGQKMLEGHALAALGEAYAKLARPARALQCYQDSLEIRRQLGDRHGEGWMLYHIAAIGLAQPDDGPSGDASTRAATIAEALTRAATIAAELEDRELVAACGQITP